MNTLISCTLVLVAVGTASAGWFGSSKPAPIKHYDVVTTLGNFQEGPYGGLHLRIEGDESNKFSNGMTISEIALLYTSEDNVFKPNEVYTQKDQVLPVHSLDHIKKASVRFFRRVSGNKVFGPDSPINVQKITISGEGESLCFKPPTGKEVLPPVHHSDTDKIDLIKC